MLTTLLVIGGGYLAVAGLAFAFQDQLLYFPSRTLVTTPDRYGLAYETVHLDTADGERLHGWWIPADDARGTLLFFHGNAGNISGRLESVKQFHQLGLNVLIIDYRGYGQSTGSPSEEGLYRDAEAAWQHAVTQRGIDPSRIVIFGRSLGGGPATWLATQHDAGALLLESAFTSVPDMAAHHYPWLPARQLTTTQFDNRSASARSTCRCSSSTARRRGHPLRARPHPLRRRPRAEAVPRHRRRSQRWLPRLRRPLPEGDRSVSGGACGAQSGRDLVRRRWGTDIA